MNLRTLAGALVVVAVLAAGGLFGVRALLDGEESLPQPQRFGEAALEGVPVDELAGEGWQLSPPPESYVPKVSNGTAKRAVGMQYSKASGRQIMLAQLETKNWGGFRGPVWIINFDPNDPDLPSDCPGSVTIYALSFVDADSGKWLFGTSKSSPSTGGCGPGGFPRVLTPFPTPVQ